jgi:hypothetical protein
MDFNAGDVIDEFGTIYTTQMWSITDILNTVTESADFPEFDGSPSMWAYLIASKSGDLHTPVLAEKILTEGFTTPICIYRGRYGAYALGNGHHRLVCAIILGMDEIPVLYTETEEYYPDASDGEDIYEEDEEISDWLFNSFTKIYKKLHKQELAALAEETRNE